MLERRDDMRAIRPATGLLHGDSVQTQNSTPANFLRVSAQLRASGVPAALCEPRELALVVARMRACMHLRFGKPADRAKSSKMTILPAHIFADFSPTGSLFCLLQACFKEAAELGVRHLDFGDTDAKASAKYDAILKAAESALRRENHYKHVKAFISETVPSQQAEKLRAILLNHDAAMVSFPSVATHVIYPDPDDTNESETDDQALVRVLQRKTLDGGEEVCYVHWLHHPDSYDDWVPADEVLGHTFKPKSRTELDQWHVQARWVRDLELYNEWMNELDYEMPRDFKDFIGRPPADPTETKLVSRFTRVRLRLRRPNPAKVEEKQEESEVHMVGLPSIPDQHTNGNHAPLNGEENGDNRSESDESMMDVEHDGEHSPSKDGDDDNESVSDGNAKISVGDGVYIPAFSKWFDLNKVHEIEQRALPEFFNSRFASKTNDTYKNIRNFMVTTWRKTPGGHLSATAARRNLGGDACAVMRVHGFLEHWGLINYGFTDNARPPTFNPPPKAMPLAIGLDEGCGDMNSVRLLLDNGTKGEVKNWQLQKYRPDGRPLMNPRTANTMLRDSEKGGYPPLPPPPTRDPIEYHCDSCGIDCSVLRFHCATKADVDLCAGCYQAGKYSSTMQPRDFIQMNTPGAFGNSDESLSDVWTESETLLLLEALEMYADNWQLVSEHVGSKGKSQCVTHFLRLPIEDGFLRTARRKWWCEHPEMDKKLPTPAALLRSAGARENVMLNVTSKLANPKALSGQPVVFGDQISSIVAFVRNLTGSVSESMIMELLDGMQLNEAKRRIRRPFLNLVESEDEPAADTDHVEGDAPNDQNCDDLKKKTLTNSVYEGLLREAGSAADIVRSKYGEQLSRACHALVNEGYIDKSKRRKISFARSEHNIHRKCTDDEDTEKENDSYTNVEPECAESGALLLGLMAGVVSAAKRRAAEEVELERLHTMAIEIRMQFIRSKMKHLYRLSSHMERCDAIRKRKRVAVAFEAVRRRKLDDYQKPPSTESIPTLKITPLEDKSNKNSDQQDMGSNAGQGETTDASKADSAEEPRENGTGVELRETNSAEVSTDQAKNSTEKSAETTVEIGLEKAAGKAGHDTSQIGNENFEGDRERGALQNETANMDSLMESKQAEANGILPKDGTSDGKEGVREDHDVEMSTS